MSAWLWTADGWRHRPWWKVAINTILRVFQPQARKWVVYTVTDPPPDDPAHPPRVLGYGFGRVLHRRWT